VLFETARRAAAAHDRVMASRSFPRVTGRALLDLRAIPTVEFRRAEVVFSPGDACDSVMYIRKGGVKLSKMSKSGREAVVAVLGPGDFLGEGCLAGQSTRIQSATAMTPSTIAVVAKDEMIRLLRQRPVFDRLLSHVLIRHSTMEQDLVDQLLESPEKRLAQTLLRLARYGTRDTPQRVLHGVSEERLAVTVGTTRALISALMEKFQRAGFIEYNGRLIINRSLLNVVLRD
jgi:CRP-like cAMP-binding protein